MYHNGSNSNHNQIHFDINVKSKKVKLDWNNMLRNKTAIECWNILKHEIATFVSLKNKQNSLERNTCQKKVLEK